MAQSILETLNKFGERILQDLGNPVDFADARSAQTQLEVPVASNPKWSDVSDDGNLPEDGANKRLFDAGNTLPPTGNYKAGDIFALTSDNNHLYRLNVAKQWVSIRDGTIATAAGDATQALADAATAQSAAEAAQTSANTANTAIADIASDSILSQVEKPSIVQNNTVILAEQAGIDAQATAYSITTEKTAYDNAVTALTAYLATLTTPVLWSNLTGDTTIVGATFRSKFSDVYTTKQALLDKIAEVAGTVATWAGVSGANKPEDNATVGAKAGTNLKKSDNTILADADVVTSLGTAALIASQGALATKSAVDLATTEVTNKVAENVKAARNYEAVVDAAGTGDYTTIAAAIAGGAVKIFVRAGTYTLTANLTLPNGLTLIGEDEKTTIIDCGSTTYALLCTASSTNIYIVNFTIRNCTNTTGAIQLLTTNASKIENCIFASTVADGIYISGTDNIVIKNYFSCSSDGVKSIGSNNIIIGNTFIMTSGTAITIGGSSGQSVISNNYIQGADYGIYVTSSSNIINSNFLLSIVSDGIWIGANNCVITGNHISNSGRYSLYIYNGTSGHSVSGNIFLNSTNHGIYLNAVSSSVISGNFITSQASGIYSTAANPLSNSQLSITGNTIDVSTSGLTCIFFERTNNSIVNGNCLIPNAFGFGVNISDANSNDNIVTSNQLNNQLQDLGTGTQISNNI